MQKFLKKLKIKPSYDPVIPLLGIYPNPINQYLKEKSGLPSSLHHDSQQPG